MDFAPYDFIKNHKAKDRKRFLHFKHRTFQPDDTLYFIDFFQRYYNEYESLESAFFYKRDCTVKEAISNFHCLFFKGDRALPRTKKHVSTPAKKSSCKRLNMFLRWMVRKDNNGVDFGIWNHIQPSKLMIPLDVHVFKVAKYLGILKRNRTDWEAVEELTGVLRGFDSDDPIKYDYALFTMGINKDGIIP